jgi:NADH-quinone oxidoreductase subunit M
MMIAVIALTYEHGSADVHQLCNEMARRPVDEQLAYFIAFALAFGIKVPIFPVHTWLPPAHTIAPTAGSVLLAAVLLKMGTYGLVRFCIGMFPGAAIVASPWFMALGAIGIVYGALLAWAQTDLKRLIACSSVSHLGYVVLGIFALTPAGLNGGMLQMVNHGLSTVLFRSHDLRAPPHASISSAASRRADLRAVLRGRRAVSVGCPASTDCRRLPIPARRVQAAPLWAGIGVLGLIFGAVYLLMATRKLLLGPLTRDENKQLVDINAREVVSMLPIVALVVAIGVMPSWFMAKSEHDVGKYIVNRVEQARATRTAALEHEAQRDLALVAPTERSDR